MAFCNDLEEIESHKDRKHRLRGWREAAAEAREVKRRKAALDIDYIQKNGEEVLVFNGDIAGNSVVMMQWEKGYMEALVDVLEIRAEKDNVLEVGYGLGFSYRAIQSVSPLSHDCVECSPNVLRRADQLGLRLIADTWQHYVHEARKRYECVFFDDFPLDDGSRSSLSRWITFLEAVEPLLADDCRLTGYLAHQDALERLPPGFSLARCPPFTNEKNTRPPSYCPYQRPSFGDECLLPLIIYKRNQR